MEKLEVVEQWEKRKNEYLNEWKVGLCGSICKSLPYFCLSMFCASCVSYNLRKRALRNDMSKYKCCGDFHWCSGRCCEQNCPKFCLCIEVSCLFPISVLSTRFMIQDQFNIRNGRCDNCVLWCMSGVQYLSIVCQLGATVLDNDNIEDASDLISHIADLAMCPVCSCTQTQHCIELDSRDESTDIKIEDPAAVHYPDHPSIEEQAPLIHTASGHSQKPPESSDQAIQSPTHMKGMSR